MRLTSSLGEGSTILLAAPDDRPPCDQHRFIFEFFMHLHLQGFNSRHVNPWRVPPNPLCPFPQLTSDSSFELFTSSGAGFINEFFVVDLWVHGPRSHLQMLVSFLINIRIGMLNMLLVR